MREPLLAAPRPPKPSPHLPIDVAVDQDAGPSDLLRVLARVLRGMRDADRKAACQTDN